MIRAPCLCAPPFNSAHINSKSFIKMQCVNHVWAHKDRHEGGNFTPNKVLTTRRQREDAALNRNAERYVTSLQ